jgi:hypothetical protein
MFKAGILPRRCGLILVNKYDQAVSTSRGVGMPKGTTKVKKEYATTRLLRLTVSVCTYGVVG